MRNERTRMPARRAARLIALMALAAAGRAPAQPPAPPAAVPPSAVPTAPTPTAAAPAVTPLPGGPAFISPTGEPILSPDRLSGAEHWFAAADANHDNRLTRRELRADGARFFARLDQNHDGELGPEDIEYYEFHVAPEIRVTSTNVERVSSGSDGETKDGPYPDRIGAGRLGYIDLPEPIIAMDANLDRGISHAEFDAALDQRFDLLDANHDGVLTRDELPKITGNRGNGGRRGGGQRGDGGGHRGGRGGGMGGMGGGGGGMGGGMGGMGGGGMDQ